MKTVKTVLELATEFLDKHQVKRARLIADTLLSHHLNLKRIELYMHFDRPLEESELEPFRETIKRATKHEPLDYILGEVEFFGCRIKVDSSVLIPRQETEVLLEHICQSINGKEKKTLDLCTGSGCIAAALKTQYPQLDVTGVDLSDEALEIAKQNHKQVRWLKGDLTAPVINEKFDIVICNPPYISEDEYQELEHSVRCFEPQLALVGGAKGTEFYERLEKELPEILNPGAKVFFEIGTGQGESVKKIFSKEIWANQAVLKDWAAHDRFFVLNLKENSPIMEPTYYV